MGKEKEEKKNTYKGLKRRQRHITRVKRQCLPPASLLPGVLSSNMIGGGTPWIGASI